MGAAYTTRIAAFGEDGPIDTYLYTVPATRRIVVRDIVLTTSGPVGDLYIYIKIPGSEAQNLLVLSGELVLAQHFELRQALHVDDQLWLYSTYGHVSGLITAYNLTEA